MRRLCRIEPRGLFAPSPSTEAGSPLTLCFALDALDWEGVLEPLPRQAHANPFAKFRGPALVRSQVNRSHASAATTVFELPSAGQRLEVTLLARPAHAGWLEVLKAQPDSDVRHVACMWVSTRMGPAQTPPSPAPRAAGARPSTSSHVASTGTRTSAVNDPRRRPPKTVDQPRRTTRSQRRYSGSVLGSPKCASKLRSPNQVIADTLSTAIVSTIRP